METAGTASKMEDCIDRAAKLAEDEARQLSRLLNERYARDTPVTFALYQPIPIHPFDGTGGARMVDVGPRPEGAHSRPVYQAASSGESGAFFEDVDAPFRTVPRTRPIQAMTLESYISQNPKVTYVDQVALERQRYRVAVSRWAEDDVLPRGAEIHHLGLMPTRLKLGTGQERYPITGYVYTMTDLPGGLGACPPGSIPVESQRLLWSLIFYALEAGDLALQNRLEHLLGRQRLKELENSQKVQFSEILRLVGTVLMVHHWFYPSDHVAAQFLQEATRLGEHQAAGDLTEIGSIFRHHGAMEPPTNASRPMREVPTAFEQTCADIHQLLSYAAHYAGRPAFVAHHTGKPAIAPNAVRRAVASLASLMCGRLFTVKRTMSSAWDLLPVKTPADLGQVSYTEKFVTVAAPWIGSGEIFVPVWNMKDWENITRAITQKSYSRAPFHLCPGDPELSSVHSTKPPAMYLNGIKREGDAWKATVDHDQTYNWFTDYARNRMRALKNKLNKPNS